MISRFINPDLEVKSVMLYYGGKFPKRTKPDKDVTLPTRLFPNAKFYIRCRLDGSIGENNKQYFYKLFKDYDYQLTDQLHQTEALFIHHENYNAFGGKVSQALIDMHNAIQDFESKVYIFYNDELFSGFMDLRDWLDQRAKNENFIKNNPNILEKVQKIKQYNKITLLLNEDKIEQWHLKHVNPDLEKQINISYLSDNIIYDLKKPETIKSKYQKLGVYIPLFTEKRIQVINKLFKNTDIKIKFLGSRSDELDPSIQGNGKYINNQEMKDLIKQYDWTIYIGKGRPSLYLGATFYEPIIQGLPVFIWLKTDQEKKVFPDLDCYFSNQEELNQLINKWDMKDLLEKQRNIIFKV
jgi:hypothetical protein